MINKICLCWKDFQRRWRYDPDLLYNVEQNKTRQRVYISFLTFGFFGGIIAVAILLT